MKATSAYRYVNRKWLLLYKDYMKGKISSNEYCKLRFSLEKLIWQIESKLEYTNEPKLPIVNRKFC